MINYHNKKETKKIGLRIQSLRLSKELSIEDIASMTGFDRKTIQSVEDGNNAYTSHLIEIAKALGVHPKEIFDVPMDIKPRYKLPPKRLANNKLTSRIIKLVSETDFFDTPRFVRDVILQLKEEYNIGADIKNTALVLKRLSENGVLRYVKEGRQNRYSKAKS